MSIFTTTATVYIGEDEQEVDVTCTFEYSAGSKGSWSDGQQQEPDDPAEISLLSALTSDGVDIIKSINYDQVEQLEIDALEEAVDDCDPPDYDDYDYDDQRY